jgi:lipid-A-disaccharide synthase
MGKAPALAGAGREGGISGSGWAGEKDMPKILIVTGEASGDLHGSNLAAALRAQRPDVELLGVGGAKMQAAGVRLVHGIEGLGVMGLAGLGQLWKVLRIYRFVARLLREQRLDAVVFIDNPGLNLRLAKVAKRAGHRVIYYVAPQIWAWHASRIHTIKRLVDLVLVILPFEEDLYRRAGVPCRYVGNPVLDALAPSYDRADLRKRFDIDPDACVIGLLPGSRLREVLALLPVMLAAAARLAAPVKSGKPRAFVLAQASSIPSGFINGLTAGSPVPVQIIPDQPQEVMALSDLLLVASGTATLQAAVIGTPFVLLYKASWPTYWVARMVIQVPWIGLANLIAGRSIVPELIQQDATPDRLAEEAGRLLEDEQANRAMREALREVRTALGARGASQRAAEAILKECAA